MSSVYGPSCDRTRALLSRQLDTPLSEVERRSVATHTAHCDRCRTFDRTARWLTDELRSAPLVPLPQPVTITVPVRRLPIRVVANVASAAALLAISIGGVSIARQPPADPAQPPLALGALDTRLGDPVLREMRREALLAGELHILPGTEPVRGVKPALPDS